MATERKTRKATGARRSPTPKDGGVRVWSSVGLTLCVTEDPPQFLKVEFGHERIAKSNSVEDIKRTARLIDEFNEAEIDRHLKKYRNLVAGHEPAKADTAKERARKRRVERDDTWD